MSFSASTCLRYTGLPPLGSTINIYSDSDLYTTIIATVDTSDIIDGNCPYTLLVPDGTTNIKLLDPASGCYSNVPILDNDLCLTCDLNFDFYSGATVGRIVVGNISGSCQPSITDYIINWYGPSPSTDIAFVSGKGSAFTGYQFTHPLTGSSAIFAEEGTYTPVIDKIVIDNIEFSQTGGTGYVRADLECFDAIPVTISGYTCDNGGDTSDLSQYEHRVLFVGASSGTESPPLSATFNLSANTNYFAWKFKGSSVPDKLKFTFIGSAYSDPIILEYWEVGNLGVNSFSSTNLPYSASTTEYVNKVTVLTGLTINLGDKIIMEVTPNSVNPQTNWDFYFTCLETFDCEYPPISKTPYKISGSTILATVDGCDNVNITYRVTGNTTSEVENTDFYKYMMGGYPSGTYPYQIYGLTGFIAQSTVPLHWGQTQCNTNWTPTYYPPTCSVANSNTITYKKYVSGGTGVLDFTFSSLSDLQHYYNDYQTALSYSGTPTNNTNIQYYRYMMVSIPNSTGAINCGDGTSSYNYQVHFSSIVTTGGTGPYFMKMTMPTITNGISFASCDVGCSGGTLNIVNTVNVASTGTSYNYTGTTNTGSKYVKPFNVMAVSGPNVVAPVTATTHNGYMRVYNTVLFTIPVSGTTSPYTLLSGLSGKTCSNIADNFYNAAPDNLNSSWLSYAFYYTIELTNPSVPNAFNMYAAPISANGQPNTALGSRILIYEYDGSTVISSDPAYIV